MTAHLKRPPVQPAAPGEVASPPACRPTEPEALAIYWEAVTAAGEVLVDGLIRQRQRPPREAALASLGAYATEQQIADWIARFRPAAAPLSNTA